MTEVTQRKIDAIFEEILSNCSQSRAGRRTEAFSPHRLKKKAVLSINKEKDNKSLDYPKLLLIQEIAADKEAGDPSELEIVSSPRDHPSKAAAINYIQSEAKRIAFNSSLDNMNKAPSNPTTTPNKGLNIKLLQDESTLSDNYGHTPARNTSSFMATSRENHPSEKISKTPCVGRYYPKYTAVEPSIYNVFISDLPKSNSTLTSSPSNSKSAENSLIQDDVNKSKTYVSKTKPSWPFISRSPARSSFVNSNVCKSSDLVSYNLDGLSKMRYYKTLSNMKKEAGRGETLRSVSSDLIYYPKTEQIHVANIFLDRYSSRNQLNSLPHLSRDVPRALSQLNFDNCEKIKYPSTQCFVDLSHSCKKECKKTSKKVEEKNISLLTSVNNYNNEPDIFLKGHLHSVNISKLPGRKDTLNESTRVTYDPSYECMEKHIPGTFFARSPKKDINVSNPIERSDAFYDYDISKIRPKMIHDISLESATSRSQRERVGRFLPFYFNEISIDKDMSVDLLKLPVTKRGVIKGDPRMSTHISRERRERAINKNELNELSYDYDFEKLKVSLRKGAVNFGHMVSRDERKDASFK